MQKSVSGIKTIQNYAAAANKIFLLLANNACLLRSLVLFIHRLDPILSILEKMMTLQNNYSMLQRNQLQQVVDEPSVPAAVIVAAFPELSIS